MKTHSSLKARSRRAKLFRMTLLGACVAQSASWAAETPPAPKPEAPPTNKEQTFEDTSADYSNWLELSVGGLFLDKNKAQFRQRHWIREGAFGGLEDFHWETSVGKQGLFQLDGRALLDNHDYRVRLELVQPDVGFVRAGYKEFRTWYDGSGGFYPPNGSWLRLFDDSLALDRGEAWIEGGLTLPKLPTFTFKYTHQFREGLKDSTAWGGTHPTGVSAVTRALSPSFWDINEKSDTFQGDVRHTLGNTDLGLGLRYESGKIDDALKLRFWPNEPADRRATHREQVDYDAFNVHAFTETRFSSKVFVSSGFSFTTLDTDFSGSRIYGNDYDVGYNPALANALGFLGLAGGSQMHEYVVNLNLMLTPLPHLAIVPSVRIQKEDLDASTAFLQTGALLLPDTPLTAMSDRDLLEISERLEVRYSGVTNWVFYARGDWTQGEGDLRETGGAGLGGPIARYTEDERFVQKYTVGASWYPLRRLNFDLQYYYKMRENDYDHRLDNTPNGSANRYPAYLRVQEFKTDDINFRVTFRPLKNVTLVSRYDFQLSTVDTKPDPLSLLGQAESAEITSHIFSQNVTWVPWSRLYFQAGFNYVLSRTDTPVDELTRAVLEAENNYWNVSFTTGFVLDNKTDLQAHYFYYNADNYVNNAALGVPYGVGADEHGITLGVSRRLRDNIRLNVKYGYFTYNDKTSGRNNDYDAHLVYTSLQYRF